MRKSALPHGFAFGASCLAGMAVILVVVVAVAMKQQGIGVLSPQHVLEPKEKAEIELHDDSKLKLKKALKGNVDRDGVIADLKVKLDNARESQKKAEQVAEKLIAANQNVKNNGQHQWPKRLYTYRGVGNDGGTLLFKVKSDWVLTWECRNNPQFVEINYCGVNGEFEKEKRAVNQLDGALGGFLNQDVPGIGRNPIPPNLKRSMLHDRLIEDGGKPLPLKGQTSTSRGGAYFVRLLHLKGPWKVEIWQNNNRID